MDGFEDDARVMEEVEAELAPFLRDIHLIDTRWWCHVKRLHEPSNDQGQNRKCQYDAGATPSTHTKWKVSKVIAIGLYAFALLEETLGPELVGLVPELGVVGEPPRIDKHFALRRDVISTQLLLLEVHVRHEERDGHVVTERLFHDRLEIRQPAHVWLRHGFALP